MTSTPEFYKFDHPANKLAEENVQLRAENERLNKQINSYKMLTKSLEEKKTYLLKKADQNKEAVETLASEREANAALTGENEELKRKLAVATEDLNRHASGVSTLMSECSRLEKELAEAKRDAERCIDFETFTKLISDPIVSIKSGGKSIKKELLEAMKGK